MPKISIIIPCYNHGKYLPETLSSIENSLSHYSYEIIIINDGSTDPLTNKFLKQLKDNRYHIIFQENKGVCETRNVGIKQAKGEYVLPVDADNRIMRDYIEKAASILDINPKISVVYCDSILIGEKNGVQIAGKFNLQRLMLDNFIDNCSMYRKEMWEKLGGYESLRMVAGLEDWEFWLRASFAGYKFHYLNEPLFEYRVLSNSGIRTLNSNKKRNNEIFDYFISKMPEFYGPNYVDDYIMYRFKKNPMGFAMKLILKSYLPHYFTRFANMGKLRKYI